MASPETSRSHAGLVSRLSRTRGLTGLAMVVERLWPLVLPLVLVVGLFLSLSWLGLFRLAPDWLRLAAVIAFAAAALLALYPLRFFRKPSPAEIDRRIEASNRLLHAPVRTQSDRITGSGDDPFALALWREHQKRMAERLGALEGDLPQTGVPERDPWGIRAAVALLLVIAFAFSLGPYGGRVLDAFQAAPGSEPLPARIDAWVTPPPYTRKAPIFLTADANRTQNAFTVPTGSELAVRVIGGTGGETLRFTDQAGEVFEIEPGTGDGKQPEGAEVPAASAPSGNVQFAATLSKDGVLELRQGEMPIGTWSFAVTPDSAPVIRFSDEPRRSGNGSLELSYEVEDDYGIASAHADITQADEAAPGARPLYEAPEMPLALPRPGRETARKSVRDLSEHPWAGSEVDITLKAVDGAGQQGWSQPRAMRLPERGFINPLAKALVEQRRMLALDANAKPRILELIDAITLRPDDTFTDMAHYLGVMSVRSRLDMATSDDELRSVADYFWEIALSIEEGSLTAAERRLQQAQEALKQALEDGASEEEIERLMAELRQAMNEFLREFAERAAQDPSLAQQMPMDGQELSQSDLDRMMDLIEELAKSGQRDQAQELLSQLEQMMQNLQAGRQQQGQQGGQQQSEMRQQMDKLGELMRRQQKMMNETFRLDQQQRQQGEQGQQGQNGQGSQQGQGQGQPMSPDQLAEALRQLQEGQGQLQQDLQALSEALRGMGLEPGEGFGEAGEAMGRAEGALGEAQGERAVGEQGQALQALRQGAQDMMQQMQQAQEGQDGGGQEGGRQQSSDRDPLGRPRATTGPDFGNAVEVPDEIDAQRARRILEAIRERLGNALSPELERQYLERLLDMR